MFKNIATIFIGNDGGLLHLAESQDVPIVGIFGPALYSKWGSINIQSIGVESNVSCRPCLKNYIAEIPENCHKKDLACLKNIEVDYVYNQSLKILSNFDTKYLNN